MLINTVLFRVCVGTCAGDQVTHRAGRTPTSSSTLSAMRLCRFQCSTATATISPPTNSMLAQPMQTVLVIFGQVLICVFHCAVVDSSTSAHRIMWNPACRPAYMAPLEGHRPWQPSTHNKGGLERPPVYGGRVCMRQHGCSRGYAMPLPQRWEGKRGRRRHLGCPHEAACL